MTTHRPCPLPMHERRRLAEMAGINLPYLYQCLTGRKDMHAPEAVAAEQRTNGELKRQMLRQDWRQVWPELAAAEDAKAQE